MSSGVSNDASHERVAHRPSLTALETLVDTLPLGVVVLDARTGRAVSLNREAKRVLRGLQTPGGSAKELAEVMTCRRGDGREVGLRELSLGRMQRADQTACAEEIEISVPDGRSVTKLVNATPIRGEDGAIESVLVTIQDLGPPGEPERMRAELLAIVSHELRGPLTSIKGSTATVLGAPGDFGAAEMLQFFRIIDEKADRMSRLIGDLLDAGRATGTLPVSREPADAGTRVDQARNTFRNAGSRHSPTELTASTGETGRAEPLVFGELTIDDDRRLVTLAGRRVDLTATEYELLRLLAANRGRVLTYGSALRQAWGPRYRGFVDPKLVHAVVKRLRHKLGEDASRPAYILNERGIGYRMPAPHGP